MNTYIEHYTVPQNKYFINVLDIYGYLESELKNNKNLLVYGNATGHMSKSNHRFAQKEFLKILELISKRPYSTCNFYRLGTEKIGFRFTFYETDPSRTTYFSQNDDNTYCSLWVRFANTDDIKFSTWLEIDEFECIMNSFPSVIYPEHLMEEHKNDNIIDVFYDKILPDIYKILNMNYTIGRNLIFNNIKSATK